ncbi:hypothetical protein ACFL96_07955 [Thermoproteota archaeon]
MQKKAILYFLAAVMLILTAVSATAIDILEDEIVLVGNHSTKLTGNFTVNNNGASDILMIKSEKTDLLGADGTHDIASSKIKLTPETILNLAAGANQTVFVEVDVPAAQFAQNYLAELKVKDAANESDFQIITLNLTVQPRYALSISSTSPTIVQGMSDQINVTIANTGNADITGGTYLFLPFMRSGTPLPYGGDSANLFSIPYNETEELVLTFDVPSAQLTGTYTGGIDVAVPTEEIDESEDLTVRVVMVNKDVTITPKENGNLAFDRDTGDVILASKKSFEFEVQNTGNVDLDDITIHKVNLTSGSNSIDMDDLSLSVDGFDLPKGGSAQTVVVSTDASVDSDNVSSGTYTGTFVIDYGDSTNDSISVRYDVRSAVASLVFNDVNLPEGPRESTQNKNFVIINNGDFALTDIEIYPTGYPSGTNISMVGVPSNLDVDESANISLSAYVPESQSAGVRKLATLRFNSTQLQDNADLFSDVVSKLRIKKVKLDLGDEDDTVSSDGDTSDEKLKPGDTFTVEVVVENTYDTNDNDFDMEDVVVDVIIRDIGEDEDDVEGESDYYDIDADDEETLDVDFDGDNEVGSDVDEGTYAIEITVEGEEKGSGATQDDTWTIYVKVERDNKVDLELKDVELSPSTMSCYRTSYLTIEGANLGSKSDKDSTLVIDSDGLGIHEEYEFEIGDYNDDDCDAVEDPDDSCSEIDHTEAIHVPDSVAPGNYPIKVTWYYDDKDDKGDEKTVTLRIEECGSDDSSSDSGTSSTGTSGTSDTSSTGTSGTTSQPDTTTGTTTSDLDVQFASGGTLGYTPGAGHVYASPPTSLTDTTKKGFTDSTVYLVLLGLLNLIIIVIVIGAVAGAFSKKR